MVHSEWAGEPYTSQGELEDVTARRLPLVATVSREAGNLRHWNWLLLGCIRGIGVA